MIRQSTKELIEKFKLLFPSYAHLIFSVRECIDPKETVIRLNDGTYLEFRYEKPNRWNLECLGAGSPPTLVQ